ncbi:hypothetical protein SAMN05444156_2187 [Verrucomicrobium sp. GAS474]|uniref:hypothetical protein n=1 Tax=Verrucomicrobium sp. GAS474 TaxID=1882831 RepID=UPI00087CC180|nr:hypothetical protein [Verrucomicrobium sp. GAS474]SDU13832.1 hypothetical protein SAMN05444156_2187 [Verrucomicrobium sp. GAS474]
MSVAPNPYTFARLGKRLDVETKMAEARAAGVLVTEDRDAGTVKATHQGQLVFKALDKGGGGWIVIYSSAFFSEK